MSTPHSASGDTPRVSVVIPSYNRLHSLKDTLVGLAAQTLEPSRFEVIVIDNVSTDGTFEAIAALAAQQPYCLRVERMPGANRGPAPARNYGVSLARGEVIAFTDSDCRPDPHWLEKGLAAFDDPAVAFASGIITFKPEELHQLQFFSRHTVTSGYEHPTYPTANAFYRKAQFEAFQGFSETLSFPSIFGIAVEAADTDLAWRIKEAGHRNVFVPESVVYHEVQEATPRSWLLEPLRLFLIPALVKLHPGLRQSMLAFGLFFYAGSIVYYLALVLALGVLVYRPWWLAAGAPLVLFAGALVKTRTLNPRTLVVRMGQIVLSAARIYVMSFALLYGSLRFGALVL